MVILSFAVQLLESVTVSTYLYLSGVITVASVNVGFATTLLPLAGVGSPGLGLVVNPETNEPVHA